DRPQRVAAPRLARQAVIVARELDSGSGSPGSRKPQMNGVGRSSGHVVTEYGDPLGHVGQDSQLAQDEDAEPRGVDVPGKSSQGVGAVDAVNGPEEIAGFGRPSRIAAAARRRLERGRAA